ncbi:MAG: PhzF family phenazine biosynthesis protein [Clostridiales Family XIII bacterium]|jgi:predicted PhzF superfamily epimerase YddE/YHI9|nr:PhzF family phenazine biosynthesis protein [Clostridiales Family XIII bacterium]
MRFFILDAFSDGLFGGNPAAVVLLDDKEPFPDEGVMRRAAAELRYSETVFIRKETGAADRYRLRYFTVTDEVDLCGHATIAAFSVIRDEAAENTASRGAASVSDICVRAETAQAMRWTALTNAGELDVEASDNTIMMEMAAPKDAAVITDEAEIAALYGSMGLDRERAADIKALYSDLGRNSEGAEKLAKDSGSIWRPEIISTGLPDIILPVASQSELDSIKPDFNTVSELSKKYGVVGIHAFSVIEDESREQCYHCRNFAPLYGIPEEAATGTSNGALTWYLYKKGRIREDIPACFIQGEAMGRPSMVYGLLKGEGKTLNIMIGGKSALLARGEIFLA